MSTMLVDTSLGLSEQSTAVLHLLGGFEPPDKVWDDDGKFYAYNCLTYAWYNGRERGFVLVIRDDNQEKKLLLWCYERRNSDAIMVAEVLNEDGFYFTPPTLEAFTDKVYDSAKAFSWGACGEVALHIRDRIKSYLKERKQLEKPFQTNFFTASDKTTKVYYGYEDGQPRTPTEEDIRRIEDLILQGKVEGELLPTYPAMNIVVPGIWTLYHPEDD